MGVMLNASDVQRSARGLIGQNRKRELPLKSRDGRMVKAPIESSSFSAIHQVSPINLITTEISQSLCCLFWGDIALWLGHEFVSKTFLVGGGVTRRAQCLPNEEFPHCSTTQ